MARKRLFLLLILLLLLLLFLLLIFILILHSSLCRSREQLRFSRPAFNFIPRPERSRNPAIFIAPEVRRGAARRPDNENLPRRRCVRGPETARALGHKDRHIKWLQPGCAEQLGSEMRPASRRDDDADVPRSQDGRTSHVDGKI